MTAREFFNRLAKALSLLRNISSMRVIKAYFEPSNIFTTLPQAGEEVVAPPVISPLRQ